MCRPFLDLNPNNKVKGVAVRQMIMIRPISPMSHDILVKTLLLPPKSIAKKKNVIAPFEGTGEGDYI